MSPRGRRGVVALAAATASLACAPSAFASPPLPSAPAPSDPPAADHVVVLAAGAPDTAATTGELERRGGFKATHRYASALRGFAARLSDEQLAELRADADVAFVTRDVTFTGQALVARAAGETVPAGIRRIRSADLLGVHAASTAAVAVLDTGLDLGHPDLNVVGGVNCIKPGAAAQDDNGHGTHVGATIAGRNTGSGVAGVAPGTPLYAVKILNAKNSGTLSQILCGIDWVARNASALGIRVANMSIGGSGSSDGNCGRTKQDPQHTAVCNAVAAGVSVVASAGNSRTGIAGIVPAAYPEVLAVSAMTDTDGAAGGRGPASCVRGEVDDTGWSGSNHGITAADAAHLIAAPGVCVVSAARGGGTSTMTGTSMAAPHVSGTIALCANSGGVAGPCAGLTPAQTMARVRADAQVATGLGLGFGGDPARPVAGKVYGHLVSAGSY